MNAAPSAAPAAAPVADAPARKTFDAFQRWYTNPAKRRRNEWPEDLTESDLEEMAALVPRFLHPDVSGLVLARALGVLLAHLAKVRAAHADRAATLLEASNREVQRRQDLERTVTGLRIDLGAAEAALGRRTMEMEEARLCEVYRRRRAEARAGDLTASFELRHRADMRAIARWQAATGRDMEWPDHADLVVWLLERLEAAECRATELERQAGDRVTVMHAAADELERLWIEHGDGDASPKLAMRLRGELGGCYPGRCRSYQMIKKMLDGERSVSWAAMELLRPMLGAAVALVEHAECVTDDITGSMTAPASYIHDLFAALPEGERNRITADRAAGISSTEGA